MNSESGRLGRFRKNFRRQLFFEKENTRGDIGMTKEILKKIQEEFENKEIFFCNKGCTERINFEQSGISLCHEAAIDTRPSEVIHFCDVKTFSAREYYRKIYLLLKKFQNEDFACRECPYCVKGKYKFKKIGFVTINTSGYCNSSCIYCGSHWEEKGIGWNPSPYIVEFAEQGLFTKECLFDWGGGEPTLNPFFEEMVTLLSERGFRQRINTNGIVFSKATYQALMKKTASLRLSIDSGSEQCFRIVKGNTFYNEVWENIRKYCSVSDNIAVKYNVCNYNSDLKEIELFLENCKKAGVKKIHIDAEIKSYQPEKNAGPFYFTRKEFDAAHYMEEFAKKMGFTVEVSGYAFSARAEFINGKLALPQKYYDNIDYSVISNNIFLTTFSNIDIFIEQIKASGGTCLIFGEKKFSNLIDKVLRSNQISTIHVRNREEFIEFCDTKSDEELGGLIVVIADRGWKRELQIINEQPSKINNVYWLPEIFYEHYVRNELNMPMYSSLTAIIPKGSKVVIYGMGKVGKDYYRQIQKDDNYVLVGAVDKNYFIYQDSDWCVCEPERLVDLVYDYIFIAVVNLAERKKIREYLNLIGCRDEQIIDFQNEMNC